MKKCPQCGTILEETKKKCYMCGAELQKKSFVDFGDAFDEQVGATITSSQDNVFNNVTSVVGGAQNNIGGDANQVTFSNAMSSAQELQDQVGSDVPQQYDNRTAIEKIFSTDARYQNYDDFNMNNAMNQNNQEFFTAPTESAPIMPPPPPPEPHVNKNFINEEVINKKIKEKPAINWGDNLKGGLFGKKDDEEDGEKKGFKFNLNTLFNIGSVVFFIVAVVFLYIKFIDSKEVETKQKIAGLTYEISEEFDFKGDSGPSRYYTYGPACALRINYGATVDASGFLDNYFESVKASNKDAITRNSEIKVNGNVWTEISVLDLRENAAVANGYAEVLKYKYVAIVHKGNFYDIVFANDNDNTQCAQMFEKFMRSLELE